jgi:hypothetical protein
MSNRHKSGLHKEISSIFSGVPLPSDKADGPLMDMDKKDKSAGHIPPMPTTAVKGPQLNHQEQPKPSPAAEEKSVPAPEMSSKGSLSKKLGLNALRENLNKFLRPMMEKLMTPPEGVSRTKHMTMLVLIPTLFMVVVLVFGRLLLKSSAKSKAAKDDDTKISSVASKSQIQWQQPAAYPAGLRDPMKMGSRHTVSTVVDTQPTMDSVIVVRGIAWSEDRPAVVIGTEIYYQGQTVRDAKIIKINTDSVEFEKDGKNWTQKVSN